MERFSNKGVVVFLFLMITGFFMQSQSLIARDHLPYRQELSPDIRFWKKVFTEVSANQYLLHDSQYLSIIYTVVTFDSMVDERRRQRYLKQLKEKYERLLHQFHHNLNDTTDLQVWEQRVYDKFKDIEEDDKFQKAAKRVRAQQGIREAFTEGLERSFAYLPMMKEIFKRYELPEELIHMPHIESSFNIHAASRVGAKGMWQFMWSTARYFMRINNFVDQRFDPVYSTEAAARLLKRNYEELHDWALAITAYNHGLAGMKRAKGKFGGDYLKIREGYLKRSFGFASKNFYPEFLAAVELMDSLEYYFPEIEQHPPFSFSEIVLPKAVNLPQFSKALNLNIAELKELNPSYKSAVWNGQIRVKDGYSLRLPLKTDLRQALAYFGADPSPAAKAEVEIALNMEDIGEFVEVSFTKPRVLIEEGSFTMTSDMLAYLEPEERPEPLTLPLVTFSKPGIQIDDETEPNLNEMMAHVDHAAEAGLAQTAAVSRSGQEDSFDEMPAFVLNKPAVDYLDPLPVIDIEIFESANQSSAAMASHSRLESDEKAAAIFGDTESEDEYQPTSTAYLSITLGEIRGILEQRLKVETDNIMVFPNETLGHIAEWLGVNAGYLRSLNGLQYGKKIYSGQILKLDFSYISPEQFSTRRLVYHLNLVEEMLEGRSEVRLVEHTVNPGENLWNIARERYNFPVNLLLYFNDLNKLEQLYPGDKIKLPMI